jgi:hypothetical protein
MVKCYLCGKEIYKGMAHLVVRDFMDSSWPIKNDVDYHESCYAEYWIGVGEWQQKYNSVKESQPTTPPEGEEKHFHKVIYPESDTALCAKIDQRCLTCGILRERYGTGNMFCDYCPKCDFCTASETREVPAQKPPEMPEMLEQIKPWADDFKTMAEIKLFNKSNEQTASINKIIDVLAKLLERN